MNSLRSINLNLLVVLHELLLERNVTRAATKLAMSQSAVSHSLAKLREMFNDELFVTSRYGIKPTARAIEMLSELEEILQQTGRLLNGNKYEISTMRRTFRIAISDYGSYLFLPSLLERIRSQASGVELVLFQSDHHLIAEQLESNTIHMGFCIADAVYQELQTTHLYHERLVCVAGKKAEIKEQRQLTVETYLSLLHIVVSGLKDGYSEIDSLLHQKGHKKTVAAVVPQCPVAAHAVIDSNMILTLPYRLAVSLPELRKLNIYELPFETGLYSYSIIWHSRSKADPGHQWLIEQFIEVAKQVEENTGSKLQNEIK